MAKIELLMPKMGESVMEGTVLNWLKKVGETIEEDEAILEVATDKVDTEIPSTHAGILSEILANEGDVVQVGKPIAIIDATSDNTAETQEKSHESVEPAAVEEAQSLVRSAIAAHSTSSSEAITARDGDRFYSPLVRNIAKTENISTAELASMEGTGKDGRVTKTDLLNYLDKRKSTVITPMTTSKPSENGTKIRVAEPMPVSISGEDEIIEMDRMRKMIAERMVASKAISPHVTSFVEADMTRIVNWRSKMKKMYSEKHGQTLTFTPIIIEAIVKAIQDFPMINIQVDGDRIIKKAAINIGVAVALPTGNLIVPVIHHAAKLNLLGLTEKVNDLASRARENKLKPDELSGGTFTVSNVGSFGNVMGTPIIMQPQVAIMALGAIQKKPAVIETPDGDMIGIRHKMFLSHSYDHRVVDGALGGMLVRRVADYLEKFDSNREY